MEVSHANTAVTSDTRCGGSYSSRYGTKVKPACDGVEFGIVQFTNIADHFDYPESGPPTEAASEPIVWPENYGAGQINPALMPPDH